MHDDGIVLYSLHHDIAEALPLKGRVLKLFRLKTKVYIRLDRNKTRGKQVKKDGVQEYHAGRQSFANRKTVGKDFHPTDEM